MKTGQLSPQRRQTGAVLIMVLWTATILTIMVTVLAANVRLSATTAWHNRTGSEDLVAVMSTLNKAEMELIMERMPPPPDLERILDDEGLQRIPAYRFNGQPLSLHYPADEDMVVRIYDHAGKINLNRIPRNNLRQIIERRLGPDHDPSRVDELLAAWTDWADLNDQPVPGGAESQYYQSLEVPYRARNNPELDSVEEMRLIRGFDALFEGVNLQAAFTIYGSGRTVNLNLATREAMELLPGLDDDSIERILSYREQRDFRNRGDVGQIVPLEQMSELSPWIGNNTSSYYSVYVYPRTEDESAGRDAAVADDEGGDAEEPPRVRQAYRQILEVRSPTQRATVLQVHPYGRLPDTSPPEVELDLSGLGSQF
ncbi:MAG: hypothetical protein WEB57_00950 [Pseudohongiellaceae bacterium]